jgi:hypothetical protein
MAKTLMNTFNETDDYGTQEAVVNVLNSIETEIYYRALLEELPRLVDEAPEWAESLLLRNRNPFRFISRDDKNNL